MPKRKALKSEASKHVTDQLSWLYAGSVVINVVDGTAVVPAARTAGM